jgi:hypothetical protein
MRAGIQVPDRVDQFEGKPRGRVHRHIESNQLGRA